MFDNNALEIFARMNHKTLELLEGMRVYSIMQKPATLVFEIFRLLPPPSLSRS
jgi:hypothetical protein